MDDPLNTYTPGQWRPEFECPEEPELRRRRPSGLGSEQPRPQNTQQQQQRRRRRWGPRKCRICLDEEQPRFDTPEGIASSFLNAGSAAKPRYVSDDPELGRLMSPCLCKGSQKYVHEGCLEAWRHANQNHSDRNMWRCPTCGFEYKMSRLSWGRFLADWRVNLLLTVLVVAGAMFLLGFVGDKIVDLYLDPWGFLFGSEPVSPPIKQYRSREEIEFDRLMKAAEATWSWHFLKGFFSLGVIGFIKAALASPFYYFNLGGRRRRGDARDRYADVNLMVVVIGAATFVWASWKFVRRLTRQWLDRIKETIVDIGDDDPEEEEEDDDEARETRI